MRRVASSTVVAFSVRASRISRCVLWMRSVVSSIASRGGFNCAGIGGHGGGCAAVSAASGTTAAPTRMASLFTCTDRRPRISDRLDAQQRAVLFVRQQIQQPVRALTHFADALSELAEHRLAAQFLGLRVEDDAL